MKNSKGYATEREAKSKAHDGYITIYDRDQGMWFNWSSKFGYQVKK